MAARKYHTLLERIGPNGTWSIEFGDYDRQTVVDEMQDRIDSGAKRKLCKIITTGATQADIVAAVMILNGRLEVVHVS